jgi:hypothetical protein
MTVPSWKAERYLLGELPAREMASLASLEKESGEFHTQLECLKKSNEELLAKHPAKGLPKRFMIIEANKWLIPMSAVAALLMCITAFLVVFGNRESAIVMNEDGTRAKGLTAGLEIWRKTGNSAEKLANNSEARAGDLLQVRYITQEKCYGIILSKDGNGVLTMHLTGENGKAAALEAGKIISLEKAYELDDAPKFETFYLFTAKEKFELAPVAEMLLRGKQPANLEVSQITLKKK